QGAIKYGHPKPDYLDPEVMCKAIDDWDKLENGLRLGGQALIRLADEVKRMRVLAFPPPPMFDKGEATLEPYWDTTMNVVAEALPKDEAAAAPNDKPPDEGAQSDATPDKIGAPSDATPAD